MKDSNTLSMENPAEDNIFKNILKCYPSYENILEKTIKDETKEDEFDDTITNYYTLLTTVWLVKYLLLDITKKSFKIETILEDLKEIEKAEAISKINLDLHDEKEDYVFQRKMLPTFKSYKIYINKLVKINIEFGALLKYLGQSTNA